VTLARGRASHISQFACRMSHVATQSSKHKKSSKGQMERVTESLVENGKRAREELSGGSYKSRLQQYTRANNEGLSVDFAQMQKDKRYYGRLKKADQAAKRAVSPLD
jgi:hypothetical protein